MRIFGSEHTLDVWRGSTAVVAGFVLLLVGALGPLSAASAGQPSTERLGDGADVVTSAVALSQRTFTDGAAELVVLGRDDDFPDSLAATALAGDRGPILYTTGGPDDEIRPETLTEILRVFTPGDVPCDQTDDVIIVGGSDVVSERAAQQIRDAGPCVRRIDGPTRYETARLIADEVGERENATTVLIARADDWADAATGGAYAAYSGTPVLVTDTGSLHPEALAFLQSSSITEAVILGGPAAISSATEAEIASLVNVRRVAGAARDQTALAIDSDLWGPRPVLGDQMVLVNGYTDLGWAYAFAAAPYSAASASPQLYTQPDVLTGSTCQRLTADVGAARVIGPTDVISDEVRGQAETAMTAGTCDGGTPGGNASENGLAMVVNEFTADAAHPAGLYVAEASGLGSRLLASGQFGFPAWHPDRDLIAVVEVGTDGSGDSVVLFSLDGSRETLFHVDPGEQIGRVAFDPTVTSPVEVAYELVLDGPVGEGGDPGIYIETYSEPGGRERWTSGGAQMSDEPYSADGRLTYFESGQVIYQDADSNPQVLDFGSFAEPEWGPDGSIAYQTNEGVVVRQVGSADPAVLVGPGSFGEADWYPAIPGQEPRLAFNASGLVDGSEIHAVGNGPTILGWVTGVSPDVSPDGRFLATSVQNGQSVAVYAADTFGVTSAVDVPAASFAYPPSLFAAP